MATNVGKFLGKVKETFKKDHSLKKIFNKNTLKLSYSCKPNLGSNINTHNTESVIKEKPRTLEKTCNCGSAKPANGKCLTNNVIYQATIQSDGRSKTYIGLKFMFQTWAINLSSKRMNLRPDIVTTRTQHHLDTKLRTKQPSREQN